MGEISEMILDGTLCERCGTLMEDLLVEASKALKEAPGHPRLCSDCLKDKGSY